MKNFDISISELNELEIPKYAPIFSCVGDLFGDYDGIYFKLIIDEKEYILQRRDDLFVLYQVFDKNEVSYEMFSVDENYNVISAGFDDYEMHTIAGDRVIQRRDSNNIESIVFIKRSDGVDFDGFDGSVGYIQYNQEKDVRLMLIYQQMYNSQNRIYGYHVGKLPFQILIEKGIYAKQKGSLKPIKSEKYIKEEYDFRDDPYLYKIALIKENGLSDYLHGNSFSVLNNKQISRYYRMLAKTKKGYAITTFPFGRQYKYEDFVTIFEEYGFKSEVPEFLLSIHNGDNIDLKRYEAVAEFMREIEMTPPDEVIKLNLKFGVGDDGTNS